MYYINEYSINREYGGPEEGGWWYETGKYITCHGIAAAFTLALNIKEEKLPIVIRKREEENQHPTGSVLCTGWSTIFIDTEPGKDYPTKKPIYE